MKFRVHAANPKTGEEFDWEVEAPSIQDAERMAQDGGMLVSAVVPIDDAPAAPPPHTRSKKAAVLCPTCKAGALHRRKKYRMSGPVVTIGYILLIPSVLGVLISLLFLFAFGSATSVTIDSMKDDTRADLVEAGVPDPIIQDVLGFVPVDDNDLADLSGEQRSAVEVAQLALGASLVGAGIGGAFGGGASICFGVSFFIGGLLGWLLIMKKKVLQCVSCGAVIAAS